METLYQIPLTAKERKQIIQRLELLDPETSDSFHFPVEDLIAFMKHSWRRKQHSREFDRNSGRTIAYRIFFSSPDETWDRLCGRSGYYRLHPVTLECLDFELTVLS